MTFALTQRSLDRLAGVHPSLIKVVLRTAELSQDQFVVTEGVRTAAKQKEYFAAGKSKTMMSRHLIESNECGYSCAVDLAIWDDRDEDKVVDVDELSWRFERYAVLAKVVKQAATEVSVPIEWGGDWKFKDGPHFQLPWSKYP